MTHWSCPCDEEGETVTYTEVALSTCLGTGMAGGGGGAVVWWVLSSLTSRSRIASEKKKEKKKGEKNEKKNEVKGDTFRL